MVKVKNNPTVSVITPKGILSVYDGSGEHNI